ncbi:MAG: cupin domain-containing protein [Gammaproteobacteria bacterium]
MKKIKIENAPIRRGSGYPEPYDQPCRNRTRWRLGNAADLTQFGVNLLHLPPGAWSSQRHWHETEDEFVWVLEGEVALVTNNGEEVLRAGDCAGFKAGDPDGHQLQNRSDKLAVILEIGTRNPKGDGVDYPDIDLAIRAGASGYVHKDGRPYTPQAHK